MTIKWCLMVSILAMVGNGHPPRAYAPTSRALQFAALCSVFHKVARVVGNGFVLKALPRVWNFNFVLCTRSLAQVGSLVRSRNAVSTLLRKVLYGIEDRRYRFLAAVATWQPWLCHLACLLMISLTRPDKLLAAVFQPSTSLPMRVAVVTCSRAVLVRTVVQCSSYPRPSS